MIRFINEKVSFDLKEKQKVKNWLKDVALGYGKKTGEISYIFMDDNNLHQINLEYLNHDTLTDIITFDLSESEIIIDADIYISIERVKENADELGEAFEQELRRVLVHGLLHLCGFKDKSASEALKMRDLEVDALKRY